MYVGQQLHYDKSFNIGDYIASKRREARREERKLDASAAVKRRRVRRSPRPKYSPEPLADPPSLSTSPSGSSTFH
jgi:hypothetical protein